MVFVHGFGCDQNMWRFVTPSFEDDYRIVLFDYVGSGKSDLAAYDPRRYGALGGYVDDLLDVCQALDLTDTIVVAHSVSAMVAILAAKRQPQRFAHLVLIGPSPRYINDADYVGGFERSDIDSLLETMERNYIGWANSLAPVIVANPDQPERVAELAGSFCSTDPEIARRFAEVTFLSDNRSDLQGVSVPSLILQCSADVIAPPEVGAYVHQRLDLSTLHVLNATGHCPHMTHPGETVAAIQKYLREAFASRG